MVSPPQGLQSKKHEHQTALTQRTLTEGQKANRDLAHWPSVTQDKGWAKMQTWVFGINANILLINPPNHFYEYNKFPKEEKY